MSEKPLLKKKRAPDFVRRLTLAAINIFESPWGAAITSGLIYAIVSAYRGYLFEQSDFAYYNYLADSFLHGQTWLIQLPKYTRDLLIYQEKK